VIILFVSHPPAVQYNRGKVGYVLDFTIVALISIMYDFTNTATSLINNITNAIVFYFNQIKVAFGTLFIKKVLNGSVYTKYIYSPSSCCKPV